MTSVETSSNSVRGWTNGHDSTTDSGYGTSSQSLNHDRPNGDMSATSNGAMLTSNGVGQSEGSRRQHTVDTMSDRKSHANFNGAAIEGAEGQTEEDLWSSILNSVKSSRAVPVKNVIVLGERRTGKSTIVSHLSSSSPSNPSFVRNTNSEDVSFSEAGGAEKGEALADLGLGYSYFDVGDEDGEEIVARVGIYQVSSSTPAHLSLLPLALSNSAEGLPSQSGHTAEKSISRMTKKGGEGDNNQIDTRPRPSIEALRDSLFLITLDWETPWTFLSQLVEWLDVVCEVVEDGAGASKGSWSREKAVWDEMKESLETSIRTYTDPSGPAGAIQGTEGEDDEVGNASTASAIMAVSNPTALDGEEGTPLPEGCLTHNFGVPLIIVCTKADTITQLERERNYKEEQFDYIQQVLRTVCLKYGAGLFFTAQSKPSSFEILRSYVLHHLFGKSGHNTSSGAFTFPHRALTVERDVLLVPAGWDSFGKIRALRDGFDCAGMANGWEWDAQVEKVRRNRGLPKGSREAEDLAEQQVDRRMLPGLVDGDRDGVESAIKLFEDIIEDWDASAPSHVMNSSRVKEPDDQDFLLQHYNNLQREPESKSKSSRHGSNSPLSNTVVGNKSVVGPVGSSSLSLPSVERAMQEKQLLEEGKPVKSSALRKEGQGGRDRERDREREREGGGRSTPVHRNMASVTSSALQSPSLSSSEKGGSSRPTSPLGSGQVGSQTPKQSEVLHSFFQSLLKEKGPGSAGGGAGRSSASRGNATGERKSGS